MMQICNHKTMVKKSHMKPALHKLFRTHKMCLFVICVVKCDIIHSKCFTSDSIAIKSIQLPFFCNMDTTVLTPDKVSKQ